MDQKQPNWHDPACYCWPGELSQLQEEVDTLHSYLTAQHWDGKPVHADLSVGLLLYNGRDEKPVLPRLMMTHLIQSCSTTQHFIKLR